jgi:hypothetical protein
MTTLTDAVDEVLGKATDGDERESIDNRERGCGHLKPQSCYIRSDVAALSAEGGEIPRFVELDEPVEYREHTGRGAIIPGWKAFPGNSFAAHYHADGNTTTPGEDIPDHFDRLSRYGFDGDHYADITSARSHDVLMSVGATNWETPEDYIEECRDRGLNLKIPVSDSNPPPVIEPLRTRVWVIHPNGAGDSRPAIIGYAYVTRNVFTTGTEATEEDPDVPGWAEDYDTVRDDVDIVEPGDPISEDDPRHDPNQTALADHEPDDGVDYIDGGDVDDALPDDEPDPESESAAEQIDMQEEDATDADVADDLAERGADTDTDSGGPPGETSNGARVNHGQLSDAGAQRYCKPCDMWIGVDNWEEHDPRVGPDANHEYADDEDDGPHHADVLNDDGPDLRIEFGRGDIPVQDRREAFDAADDDGFLPYNALKVIAAERPKVDVGQQPDKDDLITALVDDAYAHIPDYTGGLELRGRYE